MATINPSKSPYSFSATSLLPQEEMLEIGLKKSQLIIGIPKETDPFENRVALTPLAVELLVNSGHEVIIEKDAGLASNFQNTDYSEMGGFIVDSKAEVFKSDVLLKIAPLLPQEIELLKEGQILISALHLLRQSEENIRNLMQKRVTAIAFEQLKDINGCNTVVRAMSEIAGNASIFIAAEYLSNAHGGKGVMLGGITGIPPTEIVILGAGTAGEYAARTALGFGAIVKVFDNSLSKLRRLQNSVNHPVFTSIIHPIVLAKALKSADVVIGAIRQFDGPQFVLSEDMVKTMKKGAVLIDISIDQGGCVETSSCTNHGNPVFTKHGVIHYCVPNIASRVSKTASISLSNIFAPLLIQLADSGSVNKLIKEDIGFCNGVYLYKGILTNQNIGEYFRIPYKDIGLLMAAF